MRSFKRSAITVEEAAATFAQSGAGYTSQSFIWLVAWRLLEDCFSGGKLKPEPITHPLTEGARK